MESHSGLEVAPPGRYPVSESDRTYPESQQDRTESTLPEAVPLEYKNYNIQAAGTQRGLSRTDPPTMPSNGQDTRRRCGLPVRLFYTIVTVIGVLVVGAIAGGVAGGLTSSRRQNNSAEPNTSSDGGDLTNATSSRILSTSMLSATNWTDPSGYAHRFVFFQDITGAIIARRWDAQNNTWDTNNITDILRTSRAPINPLEPSTPLASTSLSFNHTLNKVYLWYMAPDNTIASVEIPDLVDAPGAWSLNALDSATLTAYPGSQLAAAWNRCWGACAGYWTLAYQRSGDAAINVANQSNPRNPILAIEPDRVAHGSSLALTPEVQADGASVSRLTMISESLSTSTSGNLQKSTYKTSWQHDGTLLSSPLPAPSPTLQFAITLLDNFRTVVFLALLPNGTVTGSYYRSGFVPIPSVEFRGGPSNLNFTAIATSEEAMFYGIAQDEIHQYSVNDTDPSVFEYVEKVFP